MLIRWPAILRVSPVRIFGAIGAGAGVLGALWPFSQELLALCLLLAPFALPAQLLIIVMQNRALAGHPPAAAWIAVPILLGCVLNGLAWAGLARWIAWARTKQRVTFWVLVFAIGIWWGLVLMIALSSIV